MSCPARTTGQAQKKTGPPKAYPKAKNWKTVVRTEMKENPAAKEAYRQAAVQFLGVAELGERGVGGRGGVRRIGTYVGG